MQILESKVPQSHEGEIYPDSLASATALIWVKMAGDNNMKVGNILSNLKDNSKIRWILK